MAHPLAAFVLVFWGSVLFGRRGRDWRAVVVTASALIWFAGLGADWVVHPAAGMLLGFLGSRAFHRWRTHWPALLAGLIAGMFFMALGAGWLVFPLFVMGMIWLFTAALNWSGEKTPAPLGAPPAVSTLPEQAGSLPVGHFGSHPEKVAVRAARREARRQAKARLEAPPPTSAPAPATSDQERRASPALQGWGQAALARRAAKPKPLVLC